MRVNRITQAAVEDRPSGREAESSVGGALAMTQLREDGGLDQVVMVKLLSSGWKMDGCILKLEPTDLLAD